MIRKGTRVITIVDTPFVKAGEIGTVLKVNKQIILVNISNEFGENIWSFFKKELKRQSKIIRKGTKVLVVNSSYLSVPNGEIGKVISKPKNSNTVFISLDSGRTRTDGSNSNYWCMYKNELEVV